MEDAWRTSEVAMQVFNVSPQHFFPVYLALLLTDLTQKHSFFCIVSKNSSLLTFHISVLCFSLPHACMHSMAEYFFTLPNSECTLLLLNAVDWSWQVQYWFFCLFVCCIVPQTVHCVYAAKASFVSLFCYVCN